MQNQQKAVYQHFIYKNQCLYMYRTFRKHILHWIACLIECRQCALLDIFRF